jgi:hypothetical protein
VKVCHEKVRVKRNRGLHANAGRSARPWASRRGLRRAGPRAVLWRQGARPQDAVTRGTACHVGAGDELLVRRPEADRVLPLLLVPVAPVRARARCRASAAGLQLLGAENQGAGASGARIRVRVRVRARHGGRASVPQNDPASLPPLRVVRCVCMCARARAPQQGKAKIRSPTRGTADLHDRHERILSPLRAKHSGAQSRGGDGRGHTRSVGGERQWRLPEAYVHVLGAWLHAVTVCPSQFPADLVCAKQNSSGPRQHARGDSF